MKAKNRRIESARGRYLVAAGCNLLATIQVVWFYLSWVRPYIRADLYEHGLERTPYQERILMMLPMRWAHQSHFLNAVANRLSQLGLWFEFGVRPEGILQAGVDVGCVVVAGLVARAIYREASRSGILTPFVYPLVLVMISVTYCLPTVHHLRMLYDLPSLALFAVGLYLIYFRRSEVLLIAVFAVATMNRETSLMLLAFYAIAAGFDGERFELNRVFAPRTLAVVVLLTSFWLGWHHWSTVHFAANPTEAGLRWKHNLVMLINPLTWPQFFSIAGFTLPVVLWHARRIADPLLRLWLWILVPWMGLMIGVGLIIETRVFGELTPYLAVCCALVAESTVLSAFRVEGAEAK